MDNLEIARVSYILIVFSLNSLAAGFFFFSPVRSIKEKRNSIGYFTAYFVFFSMGFVFFGFAVKNPNAPMVAANNVCFIVAFYCLLFGFKHRKQQGKRTKQLINEPIIYINVVVLLCINIGLFFFVVNSYFTRAALLISNCILIMAFTFKYIPVDKTKYTYGEKIATASIILSISCGLIVLLVLKMTSQNFVYMSSLVVAQSMVSLLIVGGCLTIFLSDVSDMYYRESITDVMTGLYNRRYFFRQSSLLIKTAERHHFPISLIICDIDSFKIINDTYGHDVGDRAIKEFASIIQNEAREIDLVARHGGEEFIILMPQTSESGAMSLAERVRNRTQTCAIENAKGDKVNFTASFGVSQVDEGVDIEQQIKNADVALYHAKEKGRNNVQIYHSDMVMA